MSGNEYRESTKKFGKKFNESIHTRLDNGPTIPQTEQEEMLCNYIAQEIEEKFGVHCFCNSQNPGEEMHIEVYVSFPDDAQPNSKEYEDIIGDLEKLVDAIGAQENEGERWGDSSFTWNNDEEIFGEVWPIDGQDKEMDESGDEFLRGMGKRGVWGGTPKKRYIQILQFIGDHDGCTKIDVLKGIGSNNFGRGQYSDIFSALKIAGLIEYDRAANQYHITEKGQDVLKNAYMNDMEKNVKDDKKWKADKEMINEKLDYVGSSDKSVTLSNDCPFCGKHYEFTLDMDFDKWMDCMWKWKDG